MVFAGPQPGTYFWRGKKNFGDTLGPLIVQHFTGIESTWAAPGDSRYTSVGSVLHSLPESWGGIIAGSGSLFDRPIRLPRAKVLGVRGPLTAASFKGDFTLGDPALLVPDLVRAPKRYQLGIVPHWSDTVLETRREFRAGSLNLDPSQVVVIRPDGDPLAVVAQIASCRKIVASSLHGIIVADAYGIPRRVEMCDRFAREGGQFKFADHNAAVGVPMEVGVTQEAPRWRVQARQHELFDLVNELGRLLTGRAF